MIGIVRVSGSARNSCSRPKPSRLGIITSVRTRSGVRSRTDSKAACPSGTDCTCNAPPTGGRGIGACRHCRQPPEQEDAARTQHRAGDSGGHGTGINSSSEEISSGSRDLRGIGKPAQCLLNEWRGPEGGRGQRAGSANPVGRQVRASERQADNESAAFSRNALHPHRSTVQLDQFLHQSQSDATAFVSAAARIFDAVKTVKQRGSSCGGIPTPVSRTRQFDIVPRPRLKRRRFPSKVNLKALEIRLRTIFSHMPRSTNTGSSNAWDSPAQVRRPAFSVAERKTLASSMVKPPDRSADRWLASGRLQCARNPAEYLPAATGENRCGSPVRAGSWLPGRVRCGFWPSKSSTGPSMSVRGVRNS